MLTGLSRGMIRNDDTAHRNASAGQPPGRGRHGGLPLRAPGRSASAAIWTDRWLLVLLVLLAFARGAWALGEKSLWWDESLSLYRAQQGLASVISNEIILTDTINELVTIDNHPPLYFLFLWLSVQSWGESEFSLRFLSLAFVVLAVPLLYVTGKCLVDHRVGLGAAALGALSPMYLWYGQEARMYAMLAFFSLLSFYCFVRAFFDSFGLSNLRTQWRWIAAYVLASACVIFTHYLSLLLVVFELTVLGVFLLQTHPWVRGTDAIVQDRAMPRRVLGLTIAAITTLSLGLFSYALVTLPRVTSRAGFRFLPLPDLLRDLLNSFSLGLSVDVGHWYVFLTDLFFLLFLILGFIRLVFFGSDKGSRSVGWLLAAYLLIPTALMYLMSYVQPAYMNSRHLILLTPAFYLLVATGLTFLPQISSARQAGRALSILGWTVIFVGVSYSTFNYFFDPAYDKDHHRQWGAFLREHVRPGDVVVVNPPHISQLYQYYADSGVPWVGLPLLGKTPEETAAKLEELRQSYDRIWLALSLTPPWGDRRRFPETWLNENAFRVNYKGFHSYASAVLVAAYLPGWPSIQQLPENAEALEIRYNPALRLSGYRLVSPPQPGKTLHVELFWSVDQASSDEASMSLRLVDGEGQVRAQGEQCAFNGLYPMWQWQPGLLLQDEHELLIQPGTPPGEYYLDLVLVSRPAQEGCLGPPGETIPPLSISDPQLDSAVTSPGEGPAPSAAEGVLLGTVTVDRPPSAASVDELGIEQPHRQRFDGLVLLGTSFAPTGQSRGLSVLKPGERFAVTLYWEARQSSLPDAKFRLRAVDADGKIWYERIVRPAGDRFPANLWEAGDRFKGQFSLELPAEAPLGRYWLELAPESPTQPMGVRSALSRLFGPKDAALRLGSFEVRDAPPSQPVVSLTPVPVPVDLEISRPMLSTLGDQVRFLGYDLESEQVRAGETVSFTLYWQAMHPLAVSYSVFTHLLGPSNQVVGQKDGIPRGGTYPTTLWEPGEIVADSYRFIVEPNASPGSHTLEIGLYQLETAQRLPVSDANGHPVPESRILLPPLTVLPPVALQDIVASTPGAGEILHRVYLPLVEGGR